MRRSLRLSFVVPFKLFSHTLLRLFNIVAARRRNAEEAKTLNWVPLVMPPIFLTMLHNKLTPL
jgi:hypothetical protein